MSEVSLNPPMVVLAWRAPAGSRISPTLNFRGRCVSLLPGNSCIGSEASAPTRNPPVYNNLQVLGVRVGT